LAFCEKLQNVPKARDIQWYVRIYFEKVGVPEQKLSLTAFNDVSNKLLAICHLRKTSSEEELTEGILELQSVFISYDEQTS
jgi:hypothetical protein